MTPLDRALDYAGQGWPVLPCRWQPGPARKRPLIAKWPEDASTHPVAITQWWRRWPEALIGVPTGTRSGVVVLDIDVKDDRANGYDSLDDLGHSILPDTPMAHTASGGLHIYFANNPERELRNSAGLLGPGLDIRGTGGFIIVPSPGSGYEWDPIHNIETVGFAPAPEWLWPPPVSRPLPAAPIRPVTGLSPYASASIEAACQAIAGAGQGQQERVLNAECFSIGTLAGAGAAPADIALAALLRAAATMPDYDPRLPWRPEELDLKVRRAFAAGQANPREARRAVR